MRSDLSVLVLEDVPLRIRDHCVEREHLATARPGFRAWSAQQQQDVVP